MKRNLEVTQPCMPPPSEFSLDAKIQHNQFAVHEQASVTSAVTGLDSYPFFLFIIRSLLHSNCQF